MKYDPSILPSVDDSVGIAGPVVAWLFFSVFAVIVCSFVGEGLALAGLIPAKAGTLFGWVVGPTLTALVLWSRMPKARAAMREQRLRETMDFAWFRNAFPSNVSEGRVRCVHCGGTNIGSRRRMNKEYIVEHHCHTCGEVLYFSKEQR